jgi:hypothetical protein
VCERLYDERARRYQRFADCAQRTAGMRTNPVPGLRRRSGILRRPAE